MDVDSLKYDEACKVAFNFELAENKARNLNSDSINKIVKSKSQKANPYTDSQESSKYKTPSQKFRGGRWHISNVIPCKNLGMFYLQN